MKKFIILFFLIIIIALALICYFIFRNSEDTNIIIDRPPLNSPTETPSNLECATDNDCKLIYSNCGCVSVPLDDSNLPENDPRTDFLEKEKNIICIWNVCHGTNVTALCKDKKCIRSDLTE